jgi:hypothetical protein
MFELLEQRGTHSDERGDISQANAGKNSIGELAV